ncbi:MAG: DNA topoisomerase I [Archaeoglobaceae archaeon]
MSWLIVVEKDIAARRIAKILFSDVKVVRNGKVNYYYSPSSDAYVIGLKGHIVELDFPEELNSWRSTPLETLLNASFVKKVKEKQICKVLKELAVRADTVTVATDFDREGELIGVEALEIIKSVNPNVRVDRARYSAITPEEIRRAFASRTGVDYNLAKAALARQKIDLLWGAVLTRLISLSAGRLGKDFLSVGRVQTPTLRLIVEREIEIRNFKPKKFYEITANFGFPAKHPKRYEDRKSAEEVLARVGEYGTVKSYDRKRVEEGRPIPFNTTEFLKEASRFMSPHRAMQIAENLYMNGYISYPRTDNTVYPKTLDLLSIVKMLASAFPKEVKIVLSQPQIIPSRGRKETSDHPPIHPTAPPGDFSREERLIYELVARRFLATLAPKAVWEVRKAEIDCNGVRFVAGGKKLVEPGWRAVYVYSGAEESEIPILRVGERLKILAKTVEEKKTKPPSRYSASSLIKLMERLNLGTKSTRHEIIRKLVNRGYVSGNPFRPSEVAFAVINTLKNFAEKITLPEMTAELEREMDLIAEGKKREEEVVETSRRMLASVLSSVNHEKLSKELRKSVRRDKIVGKCPECGGELVVKRKKKRFIGCSKYPDCSFTLPLPQKGSLVLTAKTCGKHEMREVKIREGRRTWNLGCPMCSYLQWREKVK